MDVSEYKNLLLQFFDEVNIEVTNENFENSQSVAKIGKSMYITKICRAKIEGKHYKVTVRNQLCKEMQKMREEIQKSQCVDSLTKVLNRDGFECVKEELINDKENFILCIADVDDFKNVNDTYGHPVGDSVLQKLAELFKANVKGCDCVTRWGGDEFIIIMRNIDFEVAKKRMEVIKNTITKYLNSNFKKQGIDFDIKQTISIGMVYYNHELTWEENYTIADHVLYKSKNNGKNQISTISPAKKREKKLF